MSVGQMAEITKSKADAQNGRLGVYLSMKIRT